jgi:hypothetical protein
MKSKSTIELNGNLYDAVTGKMLGQSSMSQPKTGGNIDGFFRARTSSSVRPTVQKVLVDIAAPAVAQPARPKPGVTRSTANHAKAHRPETSRRSTQTAPMQTKAAAPAPTAAHAGTINHTRAHKAQPSATLMRRAVQKPAPGFKKQANVQGALAHSIPNVIPVKHTADYIDQDRLVRATSVETSPMVAHHGKQIEPVAINLTPLAVQPVPVKPEGDVPSTAPAPQPPSNAPQGTQAKSKDIFDHALANAANFLDVKEHRAHFRKHARRHVASMAAGTLALLVIAGFAAYQNSPGLQFKVAGVQAGVATRMPNFAAAGFAYNGAKATDGKLTVGFSNKGGNYELTQQQTSWSGNDMIQAVSATDASGKPNYTTVKAGGTTVYRFGNGNATWVSGGTWYTVNGTGALSNNQVQTLVQNV